MPMPRCAAPTQDPHTGEGYDGFRETFIEKREASLPEWAAPETPEGNLFSLMAVTRIPESERDEEIRVGDSVKLADIAGER